MRKIFSFVLIAALILISKISDAQQIDSTTLNSSSIRSNLTLGSKFIPGFY